MEGSYSDLLPFRPLRRLWITVVSAATFITSLDRIVVTFIQRVLTRSPHQLCMCLLRSHTTAAAVAPLPASLETPATQSRSQISVFFLFRMLLHFHQEYRIYPQNIYTWGRCVLRPAISPFVGSPYRIGNTPMEFCLWGKKKLRAEGGNSPPYPRWGTRGNTLPPVCPGGSHASGMSWMGSHNPSKSGIGSSG